jgi:hypothetical protein
MNNTTKRHYSISKVNGHFLITGSRGAAYILVPAYWDDEDTLKAIGGRNFATILRDNGQEVHFSREAVRAAFYAGRDI